MFSHFKTLVRQHLYPLWNEATTAYYRPHYDWRHRPDLVLHGQRGNDYERHRRRVDSLSGRIEGKRILVFGCGTGKDIPSWLAYRPAQLVGFDYFAYPEEWAALKQRFPGVDLQLFQQAEGEARFEAGAFDLLASDAVLEHLQLASEYLSGLMQFLKPGGHFYSTFGPLWYGYGGDHLSGYDSLGNGYAHLVMPHAEYQAYVEAYQVGTLNRPEDDPRLWIHHDLFSRLAIDQYMEILLGVCGLEREFLAYLVDPKTIAFKRQFPEAYQALASHTGKAPEDLDVSGMTFIGRKL